MSFIALILKNLFRHKARIQAEVRPLIINFLTRYFREKGYKDPIAKANKSFYWEGQEGTYGKEKELTFGARNYPDFIITKPYLVAIEYKKSDNGGIVKQGIGQSMMHTSSKEFHYVYYLFHDQNRDKRIARSLDNEKEKEIIRMVWNQYNVFVKIIRTTLSSLESVIFSTPSPKPSLKPQKIILK